jgi:uncharacterized membrane protein HdeD (DUF308 family)
MQKMATALILIILGLIVIAFPLLGLLPIAALSGFLVLMLAVGLILIGISKMGENDVPLGIFMLILGIFALILGIEFIFNPTLFTWIVGFIVWIIGIFLIIEGIGRIFSKTGGRFCGVKDIFIGIIILFVGIFLATYTWLLGLLIGLWLLTTGLRMVYLERLKD